MSEQIAVVRRGPLRVNVNGAAGRPGDPGPPGAGVDLFDKLFIGHALLQEPVQPGWTNWLFLMEFVDDLGGLLVPPLEGAFAPHQIRFTEHGTYLVTFVAEAWAVSGDADVQGDLRISLVFNGFPTNVMVGAPPLSNRDGWRWTTVSVSTLVPHIYEPTNLTMMLLAALSSEATGNLNVSGRLMVQQLTVASGRPLAESLAKVEASRQAVALETRQ